MQYPEDVRILGWTPIRVVAVFTLGVLTGVLLGLMVSGILVLASRPDFSEAGALVLAAVALSIGGAVGAVLATTAGIGSILGLLILDNHGNFGVAQRSVIAGLGASISAVLLLSLLMLSGVFQTSLPITAVAAAGSGLVAGAIFRRFEQRSR